MNALLLLSPRLEDCIQWMSLLLYSYVECYEVRLLSIINANSIKHY